MSDDRETVILLTAHSAERMRRMLAELERAPYTDPPDLPDGWTWAWRGDCYVIGHEDRPGVTVAMLKLNPDLPFASEIADGLTRLLAALGEP